MYLSAKIPYKLFSNVEILKVDKIPLENQLPCPCYEEQEAYIGYERHLELDKLGIKYQRPSGPFLSKNEDDETLVYSQQCASGLYYGWVGSQDISEEATVGYNAFFEKELDGKISKLEGRIINALDLCGLVTGDYSIESDEAKGVYRHNNPPLEKDQFYLFVVFSVYNKIFDKKLPAIATMRLLVKYSIKAW